MVDSATENSSVSIFREYLRIKTVQPNPAYFEAVEFFRLLASKYGFTFQVLEFVQGKPVVILGFIGSISSLPAILLNSHIDVVPVDESKWRTDPFCAYKDAEGNIFGRGAQDMKCISIQHVEALARLKSSGFIPLRSIYISLVPDEEIGGNDGMKMFCESQEFKALNIGFALDEGLANPGNEVMAYFTERSAYWIVVEAFGPTGHGSQLLRDTAVDRLMKFLQHLTELRDKEYNRLSNTDGDLKLGDVTTININMINTGIVHPEGNNQYQVNIIPGEAKAALDVRISPSVDQQAFQKQVHEWAKEHDIQITVLQSQDASFITSTNPNENPWWKGIESTCTEMDIKLKKAIFPAATDSRYLRAKKIPAIGISPMNHTPVLLHDHNEYLNEKIFLKGIDFFEGLLRHLASLPRHHLDSMRMVNE